LIDEEKDLDHYVFKPFEELKAAIIDAEAIDICAIIDEESIMAQIESFKRDVRVSDSV